MARDITRNFLDGRIKNRYKNINNDFWDETQNSTFSEDNLYFEKIVFISRTRLTGGTSGLMEKSQSVDIFGNTTSRTTTLDWNNAAMTTTTTYPDSDIPEQTVTNHGRAITTRDKTGITLTFGYDPLERRISVTDPRIGTATLSYKNAMGQLEYYDHEMGRWLNRDPIEEPGSILFRKEIKSDQVVTKGISHFFKPE